MLDAAALPKRKADASSAAAWAEGDASDEEFEIDAHGPASFSDLSRMLLGMTLANSCMWRCAVSMLGASLHTSHDECWSWSALESQS